MKLYYGLAPLTLSTGGGCDRRQAADAPSPAAGCDPLKRSDQ